MISIATDPQELILIYNSNIKNHKEIFAYAKSSELPVNAMDITKEKVTGTLYSEITDLMSMEVKDLIDTDHTTFVEKHGEDVTLTNDGAIKILQNEPEMLLYPIVIKGKKAMVAKLYGDVTNFFDNDTAAVDIP